MHSLIRAVESDFEGQYAGASVATVISNNPDAGGLQAANQAGIASEVVDHQHPDCY